MTSDHLRAIPPGDFLEGAIDGGEHAGLVDGRDRVARDAERALHAAEVERRRGGDGEQAAHPVGADHGALEAPRFAREHAAHLAVHVGLVRGVDVDERGAPDEVLRRQAEQRAGGRVRHEQDSVGVDHVDRVGGPGDERAQRGGAQESRRAFTGVAPHHDGPLAGIHG